MQGTLVCPQVSSSAALVDCVSDVLLLSSLANVISSFCPCKMLGRFREHIWQVNFLVQSLLRWSCTGHPQQRPLQKLNLFLVRLLVELLSFPRCGYFQRTHISSLDLSWSVFALWYDCTDFVFVCVNTCNKTATLCGVPFGFLDKRGFSLLSHLNTGTLKIIK